MGPFSFEVNDGTWLVCFPFLLQAPCFSHGQVKSLLSQMASPSELACVYAALLLQDDDIPVSVSQHYFLLPALVHSLIGQAEKITSILKAANVGKTVFFSCLML